MKKFILRQITDIKNYGVKEFFRKILLLINFIIEIPIYIFAIFPCIAIRLISPWIIIRIDRIGSTNFGWFVLSPAMYYCKKNLKINQPSKKHIDLVYIYHKDKNYNKQIEKMWKRKLNFFPSYFLHPINSINKFIPGWKIHSLEISSTKNTRDVDNLIEKCKPLDFTKEEEIYGKELLKRFGLKENDKFVCLAVRDEAYQQSKIPSRFRDWSYHNYRNHDIDDFVLGAEELTRRGYYVFRMGVVAKKPINSNNPKIIDYANSDLRSDFMDVYLGANCSFCVSTGYGFDEVPYVFGKPIAFLVLPIGELRTHSEKFLLTTKHHVLKKERRKLSFSEIFSHGLTYAFDNKIYEKKGIELIDYKPEEIKDFIIEMSERLESKKELNYEDEKLQKTFKRLFKSNLENLNLEDKNRNPYHKAHGEIRSYFSSKFLRENKDWLR